MMLVGFAYSTSSSSFLLCNCSTAIFCLCNCCTAVANSIYVHKCTVLFLLISQFTLLQGRTV